MCVCEKVIWYLYEQFMVCVCEKVIWYPYEQNIYGINMSSTWCVCEQVIMYLCEHMVSV